MGGKASRLSDRSNEICAICQFDIIPNEGAHPETCPSHRFHRKCLIQWATTKNTCPLDNEMFFAVVSKPGHRTPIQRFRSYTEDAQSEAAEVLRLATPLVGFLPCPGCKKSDETKEQAVVVECEHRGHRDCLVKFIRKFYRCPKCHSPANELVCERGDKVFLPSRGEEPLCGICKENRPDEEWCHPDSCNHYFHRGCLFIAAKDDPRCPHNGCSIQFRFIVCDYSGSIALRADETSVECAVCGESKSELERAMLFPCCHQYHLKCLFEKPRYTFGCRVPGCGNVGSKIITERHGVFNVLCNQSSTVYSQTMAGNRFICAICRKSDPGTERAKPNACGCEFHRHCITHYVRNKRNPRCPLCNHIFDRIQCLYGDDFVQKDEDKKDAVERIGFTRRSSSVPRLDRTGEISNQLDRTVDWENGAILVNYSRSHENLL